MAKAKIVLSGYYGFGNAGDEAILFAIAESLQTGDKGAEVTVISGNPADTARRHKVKSVYLFNFWAIIKEIFSCDVLLSGGGSLLQDVTSARSFYYYITIIVLARLMGKKVIMYAQGIGPISGWLTRLIMKAVGNRVQMITVRDEGSYAELLKIGVTKPLIAVTADAVLGIREVKAAKGRAILAEFGVAESEEILLVSLREWDGWSHSKNVIAAALKEIMVKTGLKIVFVPMHYPVDVTAAKEVAEALADDAVVLDADYTTEEIISLFACAKMTLAVRLHALIFSAIAGKPFVGISYDPKVDRFLMDFDEKVICSFAEIESGKISDGVISVLQEYEVKKDKVHKVAEHLYKKACINNEMLTRLLYSGE